MSNTIELTNVSAKTKIVKLEIVGDSDLVLNKMNDTVKRQLSDKRKGKAKELEEPNIWEGITTAIHWHNSLPTDMEYSEEGLQELLTNNAPCISCFGLKKSFGEAVVRNEIDKYKTKFDANVNVVGRNNLAPIKFAQHHIDEKLMSPKKGSPVLVYLNRFEGWSAEIEIQYLENVYSLEQIINIVNLAGFGIGIGSGRTSGYGRYHVSRAL